MSWMPCHCLAEQNIPTHSPYQLTDRHDNGPSGYWLSPALPSFSFFLTSSVSATDGFLWVQKRARLFHCNPQPHRRKSLLEHWLISTKSQTRARERSLGIRPCTNSKGLPNSPGKPLWNSTCSGYTVGSGLPKTKPSSKCSWNSITGDTYNPTPTPITVRVRGWNKSISITCD